VAPACTDGPCRLCPSTRSIGSPHLSPDDLDPLWLEVTILAAGVVGTVVVLRVPTKVTSAVTVD